jgi:hypothetical protein
LVMVWSAIQNVYNASLGLGSPNCFRSSSVMMFTLDPPTNRTSSTMFLPAWTYIITMWGSITTNTIIELGLVTVIIILSWASLATTCCLKSGAILKNWPKIKVYLFYNSCQVIFLIEIYLVVSIFLVNIVTPITNKNWPKCNHFICNYMWLLIICHYSWKFLRLFLVLVIFATTLQLVCNYFSVHPSMWTTFSLVFIQEEPFMSHYLQMWLI